MTKPTVGRMVHYRSHGSPTLKDGSQRYKSECRAAVVSEVPGDTLVDLVIFNPEGLFFSHACIQDETEKAGGTWHWPEMV